MNHYPCYYNYYNINNGYYNIKIEGNSIVELDPDVATIAVGIITTNKDLQKAKSENAKITNAVIESLINAGVKNEDIQTSNYYIDRIYDYENGTRIFKEYQVTNSLVVTVRDVDSVGEIIDTAVENGANKISNVNFSLSDPTTYYRQALDQAIKNAVQKTLDMGHTLGIQVNPIPVKITEEKFDSIAVPRGPAFRAPEGETPIQPRKFEIQAKVTAEFVYNNLF